MAYYLRIFAGGSIVISTEVSASKSRRVRASAHIASRQNKPFPDLGYARVTHLKALLTDLIRLLQPMTPMVGPIKPFFAVRLTKLRSLQV